MEKIGNLMKWPLNVVKGDKNKFMVIPMFTFQITLKGHPGQVNDS